MPDIDEEKCVLRIRYNISIGDYEQFQADYNNDSKFDSKTNSRNLRKLQKCHQLRFLHCKFPKRAKLITNQRNIVEISHTVTLISQGAYFN